MEELRASRARLVQAGDAARRKLERDLHDGAQSRLVALALTLRAPATARATTRSWRALLDQAQDELKTSLAELRELARGIHPAVLTERGLEAAVQTLVAARTGAGDGGRGGRRAAAGAGGERGVLRRLGGAGERRQVRARDAGVGGGAARVRTG